MHTLRDVAIKLSEKAADVRSTERFKREAQIATAISSPHVVDVLDWGILPSGQAFLVMELLEGRDLATLLREGGPLPLEHALDIANQLLAALSAVHAAGAIHRDVKPGNAFLVRDGVVKLVDFGCGRADLPNAMTLTHSRTTIGTPLYMAPEQLRSGALDARCDLYAMAVVLYEMLSGRRPHESSSYEDLVARVCSEPPRPLVELLPELPAHIADAIMRGLERDPDRRWPSAEAFARALGGNTDSAAMTAKNPRPERRRRWTWLVIVGVAIAVVAIGATVAFRTTAVTSVDAGSPPEPEPIVAHTCESDAHCPQFRCTCKDASILLASRCDNKSCQSPATACAAICADAGGWTTSYEVAVAISSADCASSPQCRTRGECVGRFDGIYGVLCVKSCRDLDACKKKGECTDVGGDSTGCVATSAADCAASKHCKQFGTCSFANGACVISRDADCAQSDQCTNDGLCGAVNGSCGVRSADDCAELCRQSGRCVVKDNWCVATKAGCAKSQDCREHQRCTLVDGRCSR